jgi:hypothetical protein
LFHLLHKNTHANLVPVRGLHMSCRGATRRASPHPSMYRFLHFCFCVFPKIKSKLQYKYFLAVIPTLALRS